MSGKKMQRSGGRDTLKRSVADAETGEHAESEDQYQDRRKRRHDHQSDVGKHWTSLNAVRDSENTRHIGREISARQLGSQRPQPRDRYRVGLTTGSTRQGDSGDIK